MMTLEMIQLKELLEDMGLHIIYENFSKYSSKDENRDIKYYVKLLADKQGWKEDKMNGFLAKLYEINPGAVISIILKEIAIELDKKYPDHIRFSPEIYIFSANRGKIVKLDKDKIKTFKFFAAFRTKEDAEFAIKVIDELIPKKYFN